MGARIATGVDVPARAPRAVVATNGHADDTSVAFAALADGLRQRAPVIAQRILARWSSGSTTRPAPAHVDKAIRGAIESAVGAVADYLHSGLSVSPEDSRVWSATGEAAFFLSLTMSDVTKLCLWWRDGTVEAIREVAALHGVGPAVIDPVVDSVRLGADVNLVRMSKAFELTRSKLESELAEKQAHLDHQALHDPLTGLANRALLADRLHRSLLLASRRTTRPAIVLMDLDRFKAVNDAAGHSAGDQLLVEVAARLRRLVRPGDTVARFGGDEFAVLIEDLRNPTAEAMAAAGRILDSLRDPFRVAGRTLFVSASLGAAVGGPGDGPEDVIARADRAMYRAKDAGRGRAELFDPSTDLQALRRAEVANELHRALPDGQLQIAYQPVHDLTTGREVGREALLRWQHPSLGEVPPSEVIPLAEETGLIIDIGRWVLVQACCDCVLWQSEGTRVGVSVNVSGRQIEHPAFADDVERSLAASGLAPGELTLELTESLLVAGRPEARQALSRIQGLGVRVAIDDFGTGYSSLSWLARLPLDALKIDRSFVAALGLVERESTIVQAMVQLGHTLGLTIVAEGVETDTQLAELKQIGCDHAQGFLLGRPVVRANRD